jgi:hypothetical protein
MGISGAATLATTMSASEIPAAATSAMELMAVTTFGSGNTGNGKRDFGKNGSGNRGIGNSGNNDFRDWPHRRQSGALGQLRRGLGVSGLQNKAGSGATAGIGNSGNLVSGCWLKPIGLRALILATSHRCCQLCRAAGGGLLALVDKKSRILRQAWFSVRAAVCAVGKE